MALATHVSGRAIDANELASDFARLAIDVDELAIDCSVVKDVTKSVAPR